MGKVKTNYYDVLWVPKTASDVQIKKAYRQKAKLLHPDINGWDKVAEEKFKVAAEAYDVLSDPSKRSKYDEYIRLW